MADVHFFRDLMPWLKRGLAGRMAGWPDSKLILWQARSNYNIIMSSDKEIALRSLDFQARARDYPLVEIPQYKRWVEQKLSEGESEFFIIKLDATTLCILPEEVQNIDDSHFDELLAELKESL